MTIQDAIAENVQIYIPNVSELQRIWMLKCPHNKISSDRFSEIYQIANGPYMTFDIDGQIGMGTKEMTKTFITSTDIN